LGKKIVEAAINSSLSKREETGSMKNQQKHKLMDETAQL